MDDFWLIWSSDNPGWKLIPHDWMWYAFWIGNAYVGAVMIAGLALWVEWLFTGED